MTATTWEIGAPDRPLLKKGSGQSPRSNRWVTFSRSGALSVSAGTSVWEFPTPSRIYQVRLAIGTAPTGADLIVDVMKNGVSIFAAGDRPRIVAGAFTGQSSTVDDPATVEGDLFRVDIDQVGSTITGSHLTVVLVS